MPPPRHLPHMVITPHLVVSSGGQQHCHAKMVRRHDWVVHRKVALQEAGGGGGRKVDGILCINVTCQLYWLVYQKHSAHPKKIISAFKFLSFLVCLTVLFTCFAAFKALLLRSEGEEINRSGRCATTADPLGTVWSHARLLSLMSTTNPPPPSSPACKLSQTI